MKLTLRKRMVCSFSIVFSLLIIAFGSLVLHYNSSNYQKQSYDYCRKIVKANISLIDNYFLQLKNVARIVATDSDIVDAVSYREHADQINYAVELYNQRGVATKIKQLDVLSDITNAVIVDSKGEYLYYYGTSPVRGYDFNQHDWYNKAIQNQKNMVGFTNFHSTDYLLNDKNKRTVSILTPILNVSQYSFSKPAFLLCDFNLDPILTESGRNVDTQIAIFDGDTPVFFSQDSWLTDQQTTQLKQALSKNEGSFILDKSANNPVPYLVVNEASTVSGWSILGIMPLGELEQLRATNTTFVIILLVFACLLVLFLSGAISRSILVPMNRLMTKFNEIAKGGPAVEFEPTNSVEVDQIADTAKHMLRHIDQLTGEVVEEQKKLAQEQLKALQRQINPHFLNNMLQSIKALAVCGDTAAISKTTTLLGKILRYSVYNPYDQVQLKSELTYTDNYIALQNVRFQNQVTYTIDCAKEVQDFMVPKLIIQPLVENAIEHGFRQQRGGHVTISATAEDGELYIAVTNTGTAIEPEQVVQLNELLQQRNAYKECKSIGLLNVNQRLKSCFGPGAVLQILSRAGMNTSIVMTIPMGKGDGENADCNAGG